MTKLALKLKATFVKLLTYVATVTLIRLFWCFESTMDIRVWGLEHLRLLKREDPAARPLLVLWHGKGFVPITYFHGEHLCLYASHSRDPDYQGFRVAFRAFTLHMIQRLGYKVLDASQFASEARGVLHFVQTLRNDCGGTIAADGPGGPIYAAKPGAAFLAKKAGVTLLPVGAAISNGIRLDQWDYFEIPYLFSRATLVIEPPIRVPAKGTDAELEAKTQELEQALHRATRRAEEKLKSAWDGTLAPSSQSQMEIT